MSRTRLIALKNMLILGNLLSNIGGILVIDLISQRSVQRPTLEVIQLSGHIDMVYLPFFLIVLLGLTLRYEKPIRSCLHAFAAGEPVDARTRVCARRRLLNEPYLLIGMNLGGWILAAMIYPAIYHMVAPGQMHLGKVFFQTIFTGLITASISFFTLEWLLQQHLVPVFFPKGGLSRTPGAIRSSIRIRILALVITCNVIPMLAFHGVLKSAERSSVDPVMLMALFKDNIHTNSAIFISVGIFLALLVGANLTRPFQDIIRVLKRVRFGDIGGWVQVTSNDEIGYTGDVINEMTRGLEERERLRASLMLAMEIQQSLLPRKPPHFPGLDIAGKCLYCDETGGDYFDYVTIGHGESRRLAVVVGDVSGHGISSALLMATARAALRQRMALPGDLAEVMNDVNRQITEDTEESGQFITLLVLLIDPRRGELEWVRAGHEPAQLYDPSTDDFIELKGVGVALGLDREVVYQSFRCSGISPETVILLSTDGLTEATDHNGKMFGKDLIRKIIRVHASGDADFMVKALLDEQSRFTGSLPSEDDVTMVVVKFSA